MEKATSGGKKHVSFSLDQEAIYLLKVESAKTGKTMSAIIEDWIKTRCKG